MATVKAYQINNTAKVNTHPGLAPSTGKKYDRAILTCSKKDCNNEFFTSEPSSGTRAKRLCSEHFLAQPAEQAKQETAHVNAILAMLAKF